MFIRITEIILGNSSMHALTETMTRKMLLIFPNEQFIFTDSKHLTNA